MAEYNLIELTEDIINEFCGEQDQTTGNPKQEVVMKESKTQGSGTSQILNHNNQPNRREIQEQGTIFQLSAQALWNSALLQNHIHNHLKKNCVTEPGEIGRLATYIGVKYDDLLTCLNMMYPYRGSMLLSEENLC